MGGQLWFWCHTELLWKSGCKFITLIQTTNVLLWHYDTTICYCEFPANECCENCVIWFNIILNLIAACLAAKVVLWREVSCVHSSDNTRMFSVLLSQGPFCLTPTHQRGGPGHKEVGRDTAGTSGLNWLQRFHVYQAILLMDTQTLNSLFFLLTYLRKKRIKRVAWYKDLEEKATCLCPERFFSLSVYGS